MTRLRAGAAWLAAFGLAGAWELLALVHRT